MFETYNLSIELLQFCVFFIRPTEAVVGHNTAVEDCGALLARTDDRSGTLPIGLSKFQVWRLRCWTCCVWGFG